MYDAFSFMGVSYHFYNSTIDEKLKSYLMESLLSRDKIFNHIVQMGVENNKEMRSFDNIIDFNRVITPPAYTSDLEAKYIFYSNKEKHNIFYENMTDTDELYNFMLIGQKWVSSFSEAC